MHAAKSHMTVVRWVGIGAVLGGAFLYTAMAAEPTKPAVGKPAAAVQPQSVPTAADGRELFTREWLPKDSRAHGGDGLGPMFNESSCVACHSQGGIGGAGPASKNVDIVSAFPNPVQNFEDEVTATVPGFMFKAIFGNLGADQPVQKDGQAVAPAKPKQESAKETRAREKKELAKVHPGFATSRSIVLHKFGTDPAYEAFRGRLTGMNGGGDDVFFSDVQGGISHGADAAVHVEQVVPEGSVPAKPPAGATDTAPQPDTPRVAPPATEPTVVGQRIGVDFTTTTIAATSSFPMSADVARLQQESNMARGQVGFANQIGNVAISRSQRNATALFGAGLIDTIPEKTLRELADQQHKDSPTTAGRIAKLKDNKVGRWGWKAQKASLDDFALTACAVELGLNVPEHEQAGLAHKPDYKAPGLDMNRAECDALVSFLTKLPRPVARAAATKQETDYLAAGKAHFNTVGCAACHVEKVGAVDGLYGDLLLHDMGPELGDTGNYGSFIPNQPEDEQDEFIPLANNNPFNLQPSPKLTKEQLAKVTGALRQEWRTPPLWGARDSGPYLHDGRADTFEHAIAFHGGQANDARAKYFQLKPEERQQVVAFLKSLIAPELK